MTKTEKLIEKVKEQAPELMVFVLAKSNFNHPLYGFVRAGGAVAIRVRDIDTKIFDCDGGSWEAWAKMALAAIKKKNQKEQKPVTKKKKEIKPRKRRFKQ